MKTTVYYEVMSDNFASYTCDSLIEAQIYIQAFGTKLNENASQENRDYWKAQADKLTINKIIKIIEQV